MKEYARIAGDADQVSKILWFSLRVDVEYGIFIDFTYSDVSFDVMHEGLHLRVTRVSDVESGRGGADIASPNVNRHSDCTATSSGKHV